MIFSRKKFLFFCLFLLGKIFSPRLGFSATGDISASDAEEEIPIPFKTIDYFLSEKRIHYDMSFLWFKKAAEGFFEFLPEGEGYKVTLQAETKGFVGFFTSYRRHIYVSHLSYEPGKKKLRTNLFDRNVIIRNKKETTTTRMNYESRIMNWIATKNDKVIEENSRPLQEGIEYEDIISAFLNFRLGVYGPIKRGREFKINTMPEKGQSTIEVFIPEWETALKDKNLHGEGFGEDLLYIKVKVPREIFKSKTGEVSLWTDVRVIPLKAVVRDYIGFGDVKATLRESKS